MYKDANLRPSLAILFKLYSEFELPVGLWSYWQRSGVTSSGCTLRTLCSKRGKLCWHSSGTLGMKA